MSRTPTTQLFSSLFTIFPRLQTTFSYESLLLCRSLVIVLRCLRKRFILNNSEGLLEMNPIVVKRNSGQRPNKRKYHGNQHSKSNSVGNVSQESSPLSTNSDVSSTSNRVRISAFRKKIRFEILICAIYKHI
ncbi:hypothetical protein AVEN_88458-1 [Araneus ventricosus]|uniref:Uncharacterized protein n=1 Tax=Araneus ventricosus TaxID=182803 RepID=A0A4Y2JGS1_ARAVE|nr:hypothetical protein AVEN_88458-1 [Araneus ventricosus]